MSGAGKAGDPSDQEKLARALGTIIEVMVGRELSAMRASVSDLDSTLSKQIGAMKKDTTAVIEGLMNDLSSRIDGLLEKLSSAEDRQQSAMADIEERNRKTNDALQQRLMEAQAKTGERMEKLQSHMEEELAGKEQDLLNELGGLAMGLSAVQLELHQQMEASARTSSLLDNMASVLTGGQRVASPPRASAPAAKVAPPPRTRAPAAQEAGNGNDENLDSALDRVFPGGNS